MPFTFVPGGISSSPCSHEMFSPLLHSGYETVAVMGSPVRERSLYTGVSSRRLRVSPGFRSAFDETGIFDKSLSPEHCSICLKYW